MKCGLALVVIEIAMTCSAVAFADQPLKSCAEKPRPLWCDGVAGPRAADWSEQHRSEVIAGNGVVTTSHPLAAQAGLEMLRRGGNAIDAAVTTAAVLNVVEPMMTGLAGDLFAVVYVAKENRVYALDASGTAPTGATVERMNRLGYAKSADDWGPGSGMPSAGILTVTVPGAAWGWEAVLDRFGTRTMQEVLEPARAYAENGFPISEGVAQAWTVPPALSSDPHDPKGCCAQVDPDSRAVWYPGGKPPGTAEIFRNPDLARTFGLLQRDGSKAFYEGEIARAIVAKSDALGGTMTLEDLANYRGRWVEPVVSRFEGHDLYMLPPPSQNWATNLMLNVVEQCVPIWSAGRRLDELGPRDAKYWHYLVEAKKLAYEELYARNADPDFGAVPVERLLSVSHAKKLCARVDPNHASKTSRPLGEARRGGDTVVLSTADRWGNMVAWVNSNYYPFGSGITIPGYGFVLHNRGGLFSLDPTSPNALEPHKRPFNTLSAGFVMSSNRPLMTVTLMGGGMQAQGIAQVLVNVLGLGANLQAATDLARFHHDQVSNTLQLEGPLFEIVGKELSVMGHDIQPATGLFGGYQAIMVVPGPPTKTNEGSTSAGRVYRAGSDHRKDGQAVGY